MANSGRSAASDNGQSEPSRDCALCERLVNFREQARSRHPHWHNAPVPSFGEVNGALLIVGLAPGLQGANRTGRPFTGDYAGDLLYSTLSAYGFTRGIFAACPDDGLELVNCRVTNAVRCVPPENKPTPEEIRTCRSFLASTIDEMPKLKAILALGKIAHDTTVRTLVRTPVQTWRETSSRQGRTVQQLSLFEIQYEHRRSDEGDVREGFRGYQAFPRRRLAVQARCVGTARFQHRNLCRHVEFLGNACDAAFGEITTEPCR